LQTGGNGLAAMKDGKPMVDQEVSNLAQLLERIEAAAEGERVSLDDILDSVGRRSFGPVLLLAGLITLMPVIGDIPGMPSLMGLMVLVTAGQLLFHREHFWLPRWLLQRSLARPKLCKGLSWLRKPATRVDKVLRERLIWFTKGPGTLLIALTCCAIALAMTPMELVPFSANG